MVLTMGKPRFSVANGNYLYISCWGANPDWNIMADSYIAKYDLTNNQVVDTISLPGGSGRFSHCKRKIICCFTFQRQCCSFKYEKPIAFIH